MFGSVVINTEHAESSPSTITIMHYDGISAYHQQPNPVLTNIHDPVEVQQYADLVEVRMLSMQVQLQLQDAHLAFLKREIARLVVGPDCEMEGSVTGMEC